MRRQRRGRCSRSSSPTGMARISCRPAWIRWPGKDWSPLEVIVVDNASSDDSCALLRRDYPQVRLIELPRNCGFTGACNAGLRAATGELAGLLNNDTEVHQGWAAAVVDAFHRHPQAGAVASKLLLHDRRGPSAHSWRQLFAGWPRQQSRCLAAGLWSVRG